MNIYLAARFQRRLELHVYREGLEALGHKVVSSWLDQTDESDRNYPDNPAAAAKIAAQDLADLRSADCCVSLTEHVVLGSLAGRRGGRHVEFGIALALCNRLIVVGPREHLFHYHPRVEIVPTIVELLALLTPVTA